MKKYFEKCSIMSRTYVFKKASTMKLADEKKIPRELFCTQIQTFFTTKALLRLSSVCKNWRGLIESQETWQQRLWDLGIDNIEQLQQYFKINNLKTLYLALTGEIEFPQLSITESYSETEDWQIVPLNDLLVDLFTRDIKLVIADENNTNRDDEFTEAISTLNPIFYDSIVDYLVTKTQSPDKKQSDQPTTLLLDDSCTSEEQTQAINKFYREFCGDEAVFNQLKFFNLRDFIFQSFYHCFVGLFGISRSLVTRTSYAQTQVVKYNHSILVIHEAFLTVEKIADDHNPTDSLSHEQCNLREKIIIRISPSGWKLIGIHLKVKKNSLAFLGPLFEHPCAKVFLQYQQSYLKKSTFHVYEFIKARSTVTVECYLGLRRLLARSHLKVDEIHNCLEQFFYYYRRQFAIDPRNLLRCEIMNFILEVCEAHQPTSECILKRWFWLNAVTKVERDPMILQKTFNLLIRMLQDEDCRRMLLFKPAKIENLTSKYIADLEKIATTALFGLSR